jgi:hypothetical protein
MYLDVILYGSQNSRMSLLFTGNSPDMELMPVVALGALDLESEFAVTVRYYPYLPEPAAFWVVSLIFLPDSPFKACLEFE